MPALATVLPFQLDQPREKLLYKGPEALSNVELIAAMLGTGTKQVPIMALARKVADYLNGRDHIDAHELMELSGVGRARAVQIAASFEFSRRRLFKSRTVVNSHLDLLRELRPFAQRRQEHFLCVSLNGARELLEVRVVCVGGENRAWVQPRSVFAEPVAEHAAYVILAHNHPQGTLEFSSNDLQLTRKMRIAGHLMGIEVLDHVVFTAHNHLAMSNMESWQNMVSF